MEENVEKDMTPVLLEDLGMRYPTEESKERRRYGLYQCQYCGKEFEANTGNIKSGNTKSCGCHSYRYRNPHGLSYHHLYNTWALMKNRCYNPKDKRYKDYGARGIIICDRWLDIANFIEDMYPSYQEGLTLDRIDVNGDYELDNCRWAIASIQSQNTRDLYKHNKSGYRGVYWHNRDTRWIAQIYINNKRVYLGSFHTALEAGKVYERYVRLNNLEHNFTPVLNEEELEALNETK